MVAGVGTDLIEIARIERALARRPMLATRLFTDEELGYANRHTYPARQLAARFAAKEAVVKCLGTTIAPPLREIEVRTGAPPTVVLHGRAASIAAGLHIHISISHSDLHATATAIAEAPA